MSEMRHAMAEQDAAILDYLDGLLRESDVVANVANLTLISSAGASSASTFDDDPSDWSLAEAEIEDEQMESAVDLLAPEETSALAHDGELLDEEMAVEEVAIDTGEQAEPEVTQPTFAAELAESTTTEEPVVDGTPDERIEEFESPAVWSMEASETSDTSQVEATVTTEPADVVTPVDEHYLTLRVGSIKLAFPRAEIVDIIRGAEIEPLRGAPEHVAGAIMHAGKRRMVLSLAPVVIGHAAVPQMQTVVMLGGGLWGVAGGEVVEDMVVNVDQVKWRSPMERHDVRPWLAGLSRADGVAVVDTAALRRALSGTS